MVAENGRCAPTGIGGARRCAGGSAGGHNGKGDAALRHLAGKMWPAGGTHEE